ncbi:DNA-binding protein snt1, partial [Coemansia sp. RSA 1285]
MTDVMDAPADVKKQSPPVANDRAVPTLSSHPQKSSETLADSIAPKAVEPIEPADPYTDPAIVGQNCALVDSLTSVVPQSGTVLGTSGDVKQDGIDATSDSVAWQIYKSSDIQVLSKDDISDNPGGNSESDSDEDGLLEVHPPKDKLKSLVSSIYRENQIKAAEMQAKMATSFLTSYPTFVPGSYPSPTDWPFWKENVKIHEKVQPHLTKILGREKNQNTSHSRKLQEEYSELYSKWRKRVDKLDRQREAKQRSVAVGAAASGVGNGASSVGGSSGGSQSGSSFASTSNRRRHVSGSSIPTTDEFGFSLGPLFSASTNVSSSLDTTRRADDFLSDAVHSEAELQAIIERLQHDDARNPDLRSQRTAATIPNMVTDPKEREALRFNNSCHLVTDPISFYHARLPEPGTSEFRRIAYANNGDPDNYWTQSEVSAFVAAFLTHPKQFGKIASYIPYKTMNDCVLFYYRNKKPLRLKELETKSNKRVRRSRQAGVSSGGAGGRRRKERARERRERRVREEREKLAQEAAAGCAPVEYSTDVADIAASVEDGQMTNVRTSAAPSDDEGVNTIGDAQEATAFSPEEVDVLERRSRSSALLRSIIAANRQRKSQAANEGSALLGFGNNATSDDSSAQILSPMNDGDDDDDVEDESPMSANAPDVTPVSSRRGGHHNGIVSAGKARRKPSGNQTNGFSASGPLSPISPSIPVSSIDSRSRQDYYEEDGEATSMFAGSASRDVVDDEIEEGEERGSLRTGASGRVNNSNSEDDDGEEEGELVEDSHWEPRRPSRLYMELSAYAMGGSIVRTRRGRELDREKFGGDDGDYKSGTDGSDDGMGPYSAQRDHKASLAELSYDEEDEVVEASGIISGHGSGYQAAGRSSSSMHSATGDSKQQPRPRIVSRRSQSRFGATLTAVLDPYDSGRSSTTVEQGSDASAETSLYMLHRQGSHQRYALPRSPSATSDRQRIGGADLSSGDPPKESALDRYVANVAAGPKRPISSYEALFMCSPSSNATNAGVAFSINGAGTLPENESGAVSTTDSGSIGTSFNSQRRRLSASPSSSKKQFEARIDEESGAQNSVLVGAAVWLREDRKRVLRGLHKLGPDFAQVASLMPSKSMAQCRYFYYHYRTPTGTLISEIIPNSLTLAAASASAQSSDSKHGGSHSGIGSLVLPQTGMQPSTEVYSSTATKIAAHSSEQRFGKSKNRPVIARVDMSAAQDVPRPSLADVDVGVKRQRTKSPVSQQDSSSDDEDDETPLAAQLAEELAAQATVDSHSHPGTPILGTQPPIGVNTLATQQRRASELLAQARPELINPRVTPISSLVLPPKTVGLDASNELNAGVKGSSSSSQVVLGPRPPPAGAALVQGQVFGVSNGSGIHGIGRTPSPHLALPQAGGGPALTAKKSGYSSYWSVHERSAFMHFVVRLGPDWSTLAEAIGSKTGTQVRNYFRANREKLALDAVIAEYEKNKIGGTLPPMTPFQPVSAASVSCHSGQSAATGAVTGSAATTPLADDVAGKKEKRGRKRKNDRLESPGALSTLPQGPLSASTSGLGMSSDSIPLSQINRENMASVAISPNSAATGKMAAHLSQTPSAPNTAPATMTSFPTIGIDGGRAVVYTRVLAPAGDNAQQQQLQQPHQTQPSSFVQSRIAGRVVDNAAVRGMSLESGERQGSIARAESDTMSSQATPPPVEGLPRLSSSPAPGYGALHISNLMTAAPGQHSTVSNSKGTGAAFNSAMHSATTDQVSSSYAHQSTGAPHGNNKQEEREVRVTKINALLNNDSPTEGQSTSATDWFGASETPASGEMGGALKTTSEEEATGIAALALASMMGVGRLPTPTAPVPLQQRPQLPPPVPTHSQQHQYIQHQQPTPPRHPLATVPPPRQQPQYDEQLPHHMHSRHSPMPPHSLAETYVPGNTAIPASSMEHRPRLSVSSVSVSAFSPSVVARGSPMAMSPPPATHHHPFQQQHQQHHYHHLQARPSSVGPVPAYHPQHGVRGASDSPAIATYSREMSPLRVASSLAQGS